MGVFCMAPGCTNEGYKKKNVSYHSLPLKNKERLGQWLNAMKLKHPPVNRFSKVCSDHFESDSYERDLRAELMGAKPKNLLKETAVPTLFDFSRCINAGRATMNVGPGNLIKNAKASLLRRERIDSREQKKSLQELHMSLDLELSNRSLELGTDIVTEICEPPIQEPCELPQPVLKHVQVSIGVQTDDTPMCAAPCCNGEPIKCSSPCCNGAPSECAAPCCNREIPKVSTPQKKEQENVFSKESELDCSFISGIDQISDSSYETFAVEDDNEDLQSDSVSDSENEVSPVDDVKYLVFNDSLKELFQKCQGDKFCSAPLVDLHQTHRGSMVIVQGTCLNNHEFTWRSQPVMRRVAVGNLLLASSVLYTGNTYTTLAEICETMNIKIFSESRFYALQKEYMFPTVNKMWKCHQEQVLLGYVGKPDLVVAGDGRCDSPGHSAIFGTYSLMDVDTNLILASNVVKVTEVKNSNNMENEGLIRSLADLEHADVNVSTLATDRHSQITKTMRTMYPHISHQYDVWHLGKSLGKKLTKAANRKECADLQPWVKSIKNHLWWCADTCDGDVTQLKERWMSILRHIVNKHEWYVASMYTKCAHEMLTPDEERSKDWLKPGCPSHKALQAIVCDKRFMKDIESITEFCHTGDLEVFHNVLLKYVPKRLAFSYEGTVARTLLAAMDNNMNIGRKHAETKAGDKRFKLHWSKGSQDFVVRKVKDPKDFTFREELMEATLSRLVQGTDSKDGAISVPEQAMRSIGKKEKPNKLEAIQNHVTRFHRIF